MEAITVLRIMVNYKAHTMKDKEKTEFEIWLGEQQDLGDYPDGFDPDLYDL